MYNFKTNKLKVSLIFLFVGFMFTACSTRPDFAEKNYPGIIAADGKVLFYFNLEKDVLLLSQFLSLYYQGDLSEIINKTDRLSISIEGFEQESGFEIIAEGNYPRFFINTAFRREEEWIKQKGVYTFWENKIEGLYASVPLNSVALISNSDVNSGLEYINSGKRYYIPDIIRAEFEQSVLTIYSHLPGSDFYQSLNIPAGKMLIQDLFFVVRNDGSDYSIFGNLDFLNESDAKIFSTALKLGLLINLKTTGRSSIMKIVHDGRIDAVNNSIIIDNILLSSEEITDLLSVNRKITQGN